MDMKEKSELASKIASARFQKEKYAKLEEELKAQAIEAGIKDETLITMDGRTTITFSSGIEKELDLEKASAVIGPEAVANLLEIKRSGVKLTLADIPATYKKADITRNVVGTVKMYVRRNNV